MINTKLLLSVAVLSLLYSGCTEEEPKETAAPVKTVEVKAEPTVNQVTKDVVQEVKTTVEQAEEVAQDIKKTAEPIVQDVVEAVQTKITETVSPVVTSIKEVVAMPDAKKLYNKCAACHGLNAEKKALNNSEIIKDWEASKIASALKGYQNGTYGGAMKGLMVGQVANLSDKEIDALSEHIANFN